MQFLYGLRLVFLSLRKIPKVHLILWKGTVSVEFRGPLERFSTEPVPFHKTSATGNREILVFLEKISIP